MNNVVSLEQSRDYLLGRAARHRRAGRYDEAMSLLTRAQSQFGTCEELEFERAAVYEELGCVEEAMRAYLRVVREWGALKARALFQLAILAASRADTDRALSYLSRLGSADRSAVSEEAYVSLYDQLIADQSDLAAYSRKSRARALERRAVDRLREGKVFAAERTLRHAVTLNPSAQGFTLLACCALIRSDAKRAAENAHLAHHLAPARVQTLCVLTDALFLQGNAPEGRRAMGIAALRARTPEDMLAVAMESAKHGEDALTLQMTQRLLRREPFQVRAMMLRACALVNKMRLREASRLFGRLCGLLPEDTVSEFFYRMTREGEHPKERLSLGLDVPKREAAERAMRIISALYEQPQELAADPLAERAMCRTCAWAFRSTLAGEHVAVAALMLLGAMNTDAAREVMIDALTDTQLSDAFKRNVLQVLISVGGMHPYNVDLGGKLVSLAAGGVSQQQSDAQASSMPVQRACDALMPDFPNAPEVLLPLWIAYLNEYGPAKGSYADACAAALEYACHEDSGRQVDFATIARRHGATLRLSRLCLRRIRRAARLKAEK